MQRSLRKIGSKAVSLICAGALVVTLTPMAPPQAYAVAAKDVSKVITASPTPYSSAWPEFFGLSTIDERWSIDKQGETPGYSSSVTLDNRSGALRYLLMGSDYYNTNPNPYMYNTMYDVGDTAAKVLQGNGRDVNQASNPNKALGVKEGAQDMNIWAMKPDVIFGNAIDKAQTQTTDYSTEVAKLQEMFPDGTYDGYNPVGVPIAQTKDVTVDMYNVAKAANIAEQRAIAAGSPKRLRYGNAVDLVKNYETFLKGSRGYILKKLSDASAEKKTVAYVTANDGTSLTIAKELTGNAAPLAEIAKSYASTASGNSITKTIAEVTADKASIDLIVLKSDDYNSTKSTPVLPTGLEALYDKLYWVTDSDCGGVGGDKNGIDATSNCAKIIPCLYREYLDQSQMVAYYYQIVYHIKADKIAEAVDKAMDGVRNWNVTTGSDANAYLSWAASDVSDYNQSTVEANLKAGLAYLKSSNATLPDTLKLSGYLQGSVTDDGSAPLSSTKQTTYRLYNKWTGEHLFTTDVSERDFLVPLGWRDEGVGWTSPGYGKRVYRLYNKWTGDHHWTYDTDEVAACVKAGWTNEGVKFYSADDSGTPVYRLYNPYEKAFYHHYTTDANEYKVCIAAGWRDEAVGWYGA